MGHDITAHMLDKESENKFRSEVIADMRYSVGAGDRIGKFYELFDAIEFYAGVSGSGGGLIVSREKIVFALDYFCREHLNGERVIYELRFLSTILTEWDFRLEGVYLRFS